jgi:hypothetical protein
MIRSVYISVFFVFICLYAGAQGVTRHFMLDMPQSGISHVTNFPKDFSAYGGLPVLTMIYSDFNTNNLYFDRIFSERIGDTAYFDVDHLLSRLDKLNVITQENGIEFVSSGWKVNNNTYLSFLVTGRTQLELRYPKDALALFWHGNGDEFLGKEAVLDDIGLDASFFYEIAFGYTRNINDRFFIGVRPKILVGLANIQTEKSDISVYTDSASYDWHFNSSININTSSDFKGPLSLDSTALEFDYKFTSVDRIFNYIFNFKNVGLGLDFGVKYFPWSKLGISLDITDIGYIRWTRKVRNFYNNDVYFKMEGFSVDSFLNTFEDDSYSAVTDSIKELFEIQENNKAYTTHLRSKMFLGLQYNINDKNRLGAVFYKNLSPYNDYQSLSFIFSKKYGKVLSSSFSYTLAKWAYQKVGGGLAFNLGGFQLYMISDDMSSLYRPEKARSASFYFGINFFQRERMSKSRPSI